VPWEFTPSSHLGLTQSMKARLPVQPLQSLLPHHTKSLSAPRCCPETCFLLWMENGRARGAPQKTQVAAPSLGPLLHPVLLQDLRVGGTLSESRTPGASCEGLSRYPQQPPGSGRFWGPQLLVQKTLGSEPDFSPCCLPPKLEKELFMKGQEVRPLRRQPSLSLVMS
jgi:hypothetical protein